MSPNELFDRLEGLKSQLSRPIMGHTPRHYADMKPQLPTLRVTLELTDEHHEGT